MFPFNTNYPYHNFPFCFNYELQQQQIYPQFFPMFQTQIISSPEQFYILNSKANTETQDEIKRFDNLYENQPKVVQKKKRITKKLNPFSIIQAKFIFPNKSRMQNTTLKYFDPAHAPPITSLRNNVELSADFGYRLKQLKSKRPDIKGSGGNIQLKVKKLQILLKQPDPIEFPFLICKKRKYYRNMKRRYSVAYFDQRTYFIQNRIPIPPQLEPKNKHKKYNHSEDSDAQNAEQFENSQNQHDQSHKVQLIPQNAVPLKIQSIDFPIQNDQVQLQVKQEPYLQQ